VWKIRIVIVNPFVKGDVKIKRIIPLIGPDNIFFNGAHDPFGVGIAFRVGPSSEDLLDAKQYIVIPAKAGIYVFQLLIKANVFSKGS